MPSTVVNMNPEGLLGPGASSRSIKPMMMMIQRMFTTPCSFVFVPSHPLRGLAFVRDAPLWRHLIHVVRQSLRQFGKKSITRRSGLSREGIQRVCSDCFLEVVFREGRIGARPNPGIRDMTLPALLQSPDELAQ